MVPVAATDCHGSEERSSALESEAAAEFERIVAEHQERVGGLAYRLLGWRDEVEDVVQEVFLAVFQNLERFRGESRVSTWLTTITVNKCRSRLRKRFFGARFLARLREQVRSTANEAADSPDSKQENFKRVHQALRRLPARYREVVVLHHLEGMPITEIADVLGKSRNTVEVRLHRARARLRESLAELLGP